MRNRYKRETAEGNSAKEKWIRRPLARGILITVLLIACASLTALYAYNHFMGESTGDYKDSVSKLQSKVDKANSNFAAVLNKDTKQFQSDAILQQVPKTIDDFNSIIDEYNKIDPPSSYSARNKKLGDSINLNKSIYQSLQVILKNPIDTKAQDNLNQLSSLVDQCLDGYTTIGIKNISFSLPGGILSLPKRLSSWVSQKQSENSKVMALIASYSKYFDSMSELFVSYGSTRTDFSSIVKSIRNNQSTYDDLFNKIDSCEKTLNDIRSSYASLNVPSGLSNLNGKFGPILDESIIYLDKLRFAAQTEKNLNKDILTQDQINQQMEQINGLYQDAEKDNTTSFSNYQKLASDMESAKEDYLDPDYVSAHVSSN